MVPNSSAPCERPPKRFDNLATPDDVDRSMGAWRDAKSDIGIENEAPELREQRPGVPDRVPVGMCEFRRHGLPEVHSAEVARSQVFMTRFRVTQRVFIADRRRSGWTSQS